MVRGIGDDNDDDGDGPENHYDIHEVLGQGAFGKVVRATVRVEIADMTKSIAKEKTKKGQPVHHDEQDFAIKYLHIDNAKVATEGIMEATRLVRCHHPNSKYCQVPLKCVNGRPNVHTQSCRRACLMSFLRDCCVITVVTLREQFFKNTVGFCSRLLRFRSPLLKNQVGSSSLLLNLCSLFEHSGVR